MNILIRNLSKQVTEENLKELFGQFGTVSTASIVKDLTTGESRGFGFVEMPDQAEAEAAVQALHHTRQFNERLRVKEANPKFGPDYWQNEAQNAPAQPPARPRRPFPPRERTEFRGGYGKPRGADRERSRRFAPREGRSFAPSGGPHEERPPRRPFGERPYGGRPSGERGERPYSRFPKREGGRPGYAPRGERGYGYRRPEERGGQGAPRFAPREGRPFTPSGGPREGRPPRKPFGERPYGGRPSGERGGRPYSRFPKREGGTPGYAPRGERSFGYRRPEEGGGREGRRFAPREGRPQRSWGERPHGGPHARFPKREGGGHGYGHRRTGERSGHARPRFSPRSGNK